MKNKKYYIAIDLGAESGRIIVGVLESKKIVLKEIHRFESKQLKTNDTLYWDIRYIFSEIKAGLRKAVLQGFDSPTGIGIDSWGVDFGLLDENDILLENPVAYRDKRTDGIMEKVFEKIPKEELYKKTGIQFLQFNTIYQLFSLTITKKDLLKKTHSFLMIPDLLNFMLTGKKLNEYTNATTTSLLNAIKKDYDFSLLKKLNIPTRIMGEIVFPGTKIGELDINVSQEIGFKKSIDVFSVGSHDTASAIVSIPAVEKNWAYISSGTWSLLGREIDKPILTNEALKYGFTNEGGIENTIRFLKNIMGLWILQRVRKKWLDKGYKIEYKELTELACQSDSFQAYFNPDDSRFFNPEDMISELENYFIETNQKNNFGLGEISRIVLENLAFKTAYYLNQINQLHGEKVEVLHIVGGGSKNVLLNQYIANACNVKVVAGPEEGTATGNILVQAKANGDVESLNEIRGIVRNSFKIIEYFPQKEFVSVWQEKYKCFTAKCGLE